jgi:hypothetical protein
MGRHVYPRNVEISLLKNPTKRVGLVQSEPEHHIIENYLVLAMKNC